MHSTFVALVNLSCRYTHFAFFCKKNIVTSLLHNARSINAELSSPSFDLDKHAEVVLYNKHRSRTELSENGQEQFRDTSEV